MDLLFLNILLAIVCQAYVSCNKSVPVFLWESRVSSNEGSSLLSLTSIVYNNNSKGVSALKLMSSNAFGHLLKEKMKHKDLLLLFIEETLDIEDFAWKFENENSFLELERLESKANVTYLPLVFEPMSVLYNFPSESQTWYEISLTADGFDENAIRIDKENKYVLFHFRDDFRDESRMDLLKIHGKFMANVYERERHRRNILGIYTALQGYRYSSDEPKVRVSREVVPEITNDDFCCLYYGFSNDSSALLYTSSHPKLIHNNSEYVLNTTLSSTLTANETHQSWHLEFNDDISIRFHFHLSPSRMWHLSEVVSMMGDNTTLKYDGPARIEAPLKFSYHCSAHNNNKFSSNTTALLFHDIQVEAFMNVERFGDTYDCGTFMTIPILSGLFVTCILGVILVVALTMMLNIKTTDRFDDARGRTVTINATE